MANAQGRLIGGRYQLLEPIGRGGMGTVWRAYDQLLDRPIAVKEIRYDVQEDELEELNRRTMREARAAGRLTHPNVVVVHDVIEEDGRPWIIMQLVESKSLGQVLRESGRLTPGRTAQIGLEVLDALRAAHDQGVLHRDVKPENVLLTDDGRVVLTDFGIARIEADTTMTRTGLAGTPAFIAPERLRGESARRESDLWSLGATLYAAVEGKAPHERGIPVVTLHAVLNDDPEPATHAGGLGPLLDRMLRKDPADRPTHDEIAQTLRRALEPEPRPEPEQEREPEPVQQTRRLPDLTDPFEAQDRDWWTGGSSPKTKEEPAPEPSSEPSSERRPADGDLTPPVAIPLPRKAPPRAPTRASEPVRSPEPTQGQHPAPPRQREPQRAAETIPPASTPAQPTMIGDYPARPSRLPLIAAVVVALLVVAGVAVWLGMKQGAASRETGGGPSGAAVSSGEASTAEPSEDKPKPSEGTTDDTTSKPSEKPSDKPSSKPSSAAGAPEGWHTYKDSSGFSIALPKGWDAREHRGTSVTFRGPGTSGFLLIDQTSSPKKDAVKDWKNQEKSWKVRFPGYKRIKIEHVDYFDEAADAEFTYRSGGGRQHVINRGFVTGKDHGYAIYWSAPDDRWSKDLHYFETFTATFRPAD
ncbi:protein kinase [Streptosporangiaceae bacterium NEAU-GS5]|nr:protein kinase [Streptosporangiaceae bacterium NEAU-GS5]